jgi:hypothetical protein
MHRYRGLGGRASPDELLDPLRERSRRRGTAEGGDGQLCAYGFQTFPEAGGAPFHGKPEGDGQCFGRALDLGAQQPGLRQVRRRLRRHVQAGRAARSSCDQLQRPRCGPLGVGAPAEKEVRGAVRHRDALGREAELAFQVVVQLVPLPGPWAKADADRPIRLRRTAEIPEGACFDRCQPGSAGVTHTFKTLCRMYEAKGRSGIALHVGEDGEVSVRVRPQWAVLRHLAVQGGRSQKLFGRRHRTEVGCADREKRGRVPGHQVEPASLGEHLSAVQSGHGIAQNASAMRVGRVRRRVGRGPDQADEVVLHLIQGEVGHVARGRIAGAGCRGRPVEPLVQRQTVMGDTVAP